MLEQAQAVLDGKAKPPSSLGALETFAARLCDLQGTLQPEITSACLLLFAADHGITLEQPAVSAYPRQVTKSVFRAIAKGMAASSVLCKANGLHLHLVDVGVDADTSSLTTCSNNSTSYTDPVHGGTSHGVDSRSVETAAAATATATQGFTSNGSEHHANGCNRVGFGPGQVSVAIEKVLPHGSHSFLSGPALTLAEANAALDVGRRAVRRVVEQCCSGHPKGLVLCVGELGIGNTTSAAAVLAALTGASPEDTCGAGTGVDSAGLQAKRKAVADGLQLHAELIKEGPLGALRALGGLEIAAMAGAYLEAAEKGVPVVMDGFVSGTAALLAVRLAKPGHVHRVLYASHQSTERGAKLLHDELQMPAHLQMQMRLGEGTGAVLIVPLLRSACAIMRDMASLQDALQA